MAKDTNIELVKNTPQAESKPNNKNGKFNGIFIAIICILTTYQSYSQPNYINLNIENNLRFEKKFYTQPNFHSSIKPFLSSDIPSFDSLTENSDIISNNKLLYHLLNDNVFEKQLGNFKIQINPILTIAPEITINQKQIFNDYKAGFSIGGSVGNKFDFRLDGFYGIQAYYDYLDLKIDSSGLLPGYGKYLFKNGLHYHYLSITGYLSYSPSKYLNLQTGIGGNFWGEGYRSLFLSNNSPNYPFFKATVNIWRFKYIWLFGYLNDFNSDLQSNELKSKLLFSHYLSWNATPWLNFNFFESIVSNPIDSVGVTNFNVAYLNPVIFFRPVEFAGGSADNALLGFGINLKLWTKYQFYGQMVFDEFVFSEMKSGDGWWGNKFGLQGGVKAFDVFNLENLFLQLEYNAVRPYTYSYSNSILNYGNHFQALAHPSGANFEEVILLAHYHKNRFSVLAKAVFSSAGMDVDSISYGQDIYKSYTKRANDYGNAFKQGFMGDYTNVELKISWLLNPKLNHSLFICFNNQNINLSTVTSKSTYISLGIRWLMRDEKLDYL